MPRTGLGAEEPLKPRLRRVVSLEHGCPQGLALLPSCALALAPVETLSCWPDRAAPRGQGARSVPGTALARFGVTTADWAFCLQRTLLGRCTFRVTHFWALPPGSSSC